MSNIERFEELLRTDEGLQAKLRAATEAYQGDKDDERAVFEAVIAPLAAGAGLPITYDEAKELAAEGTPLADEALEAVAGGSKDNDGTSTSSCIILGWGLGADACSNEHTGAGACGGIGIGFLGF